MSYPFSNEENPFGSAEMASAQDAARAGMFRKSDTAIYCGELEGRALFYDGEGGILLVAGARSGKLRDILAYTLCKGICDGRTIIVLDPKGELAAISRDQILGEGKAKKVITFNPRALHDLPQHRINPVGYLKWSSPTLIPDLKLLLENWIPKSGSANGEYFELNARRWAEAICLTLIKMHGVLELPHLYRVLNLLSPQQLLERYGDQLDGETLNDEQAKECLSALWSIMVAFVDLGFSVKAGDKLHSKSDIGMDDVLQYLCLEDTAPETVASSKITNKKEPR